MNDWLTIDEVQDRIKSVYEFFAVTAPGVWAQESGELSALWSLYDAHVEAQRVEMTEEEFAYEYGRGAV